MKDGELKTWTDEFGNVLREDGTVLAANREWIPINPWKNDEIANAPDDQWFSLDGLIPEYQKNYTTQGKFFMNKRGQVKSTNFAKGKGKIWNSEDFTKCITRNGKEYFMFLSQPVHVLYAKLFLLNDDPKDKKIIDHIDGNSLNNSRVNLRWVTVSENNRNKIFPDTIKPIEYYYAKYNLNGEFIEWINIHDLNYYLRGKLQKSRRLSDLSFGRFESNGFLWEKHTNHSKEYIESYGEIVYSGWVESIDYPGLFANPNGCLFITYSRTKFKKINLISVGGKIGNYYKFQVNKETSHQTHRLVYCILNHISINSIKNEEIDHKSGFSNNINNLSLVNHKDNMNNPETLKKQGIAVSKLDLKTGEILGTYDSAKEAAIRSGLGNSNFILKSIKNASYTSGGFIWSKKGEEKERFQNYLSYLKSGEPKRHYWEDKINRINAASKCKNRSEYGRKYVAAARYSRKIPGEMDELFPKLNKKSLGN